MAPLQFLSTAVLLFASTLMAVGGSAEAPSSSTHHLELIHVDANGGFTKDELIRRAEHRSRIRAAALSDNDWTAAASTIDDNDKYMWDDNDKYMLGKASYSQEEYLTEAELAIGTPEKSFMAVVDTGSDVIWTKDLARCNKGASSSFARRWKECPVPYCDGCDGEVCKFSKKYGSTQMGAEGYMAKENLTLSCVAGPCVDGPNKKVKIIFGCAEDCSDCHRLIPDSSHGIVGLNMSPRSLLSQLNFSRFSYCLSNRLEPKLKSPIWFGGDKLSLGGGAAVQTTPLVSSWAKPPSVWAYRYYVQLEGISIGGDDDKPRPLVSETFNHRSDVSGKGIMFVDSGCSFSRLETGAYNVLKNLLAKELNLKSDAFHHKDGFICFNHTSGQPEPDAVLHLTGAEMRLRWSSYIHKPDEKPEHSCLMLTDSGQNMSILGNFQQQNMHMLYDRHGKKLSFVPVDDCSNQE